VNRRRVVCASSAALALAALRPLAGQGAGAVRKVVVIGAGFGGATAAKYLRLASDDIDVVLVERSIEFTSCPMSNLVIGGTKAITDIKTSFFWVSSKYGIRLATDEAVGVDPERRQVRLARSGTVDYDRLIVSPGVDFVFNEMPGMSENDPRVPHAWKAGRQTSLLRKQVEDMIDGGVFVISIPVAPYRGPAAPYERACLVAAYLRQAKPRSKVLVLDANADIVAKGDVFRKAWSELYPGMIEYRPNARVIGVDAATLTARLEGDSVKADVLNVIPPMKVGKIADPLLASGERWCQVDFATYESRSMPNVHVLGDAILSSLPKSGHLANSQGRVCANAILDIAAGRPPRSASTLEDTCYSFVASNSAARSRATYRFVPETGALAVDAGSQTIEDPSDAIGRQAQLWARNLWNDMLK
jgi:sulfite dehydrogenase